MGDYIENTMYTERNYAKKKFHTAVPPYQKDQQILPEQVKKKKNRKEKTSHLMKAILGFITIIHTRFRFV